MSKILNPFFIGGVVIMKWNKIQIVILFSLFLIILLLSFCDNQNLSNPFDPASDSFIPLTQGLLIDDFNDGKDPNLLGGYPEIFLDLDRKAIIDTFYHNESENVLRGIGYSMRIDFDVSRGEDPFGGYVQNLIGNDSDSSSGRAFNLEALNLDALKFWVKTELKRIDFEVAFKDTNNMQTYPKLYFRDYIADSIGLWNEIKIPVSNLKPAQDGKMVDLKILKEINFGFAKLHFIEISAELKGTIYIDEISFR